MLYLIAGAIATYALYSLFTKIQEDHPPSRSSSSPSSPQPPSPPCPPRPSSRRDDRQQTSVVDSSHENYPPVETYAYLMGGAVIAYALYSLFTTNTQEDSPPSRSPSLSRPSHRRDDLNFSYENNLSVELRDKAKKEGDLKARCYQQSQEAYECRDHVLAKTLSDQGKHHALNMENLNARASAIIFKGESRIPNPLDEPAKTYSENNRDQPACEIDLHGLYVKEAIAYSEKALKEARQRGDSEIRLIVGQGNHSDGGVPRLKPAIQEAMQIRGAYIEVDPKNPGVLQVVV